MWLYRKDACLGRAGRFGVMWRAVSRAGCPRYFGTANGQRQIVVQDEVHDVVENMVHDEVHDMVSAPSNYHLNFIINPIAVPCLHPQPPFVNSLLPYVVCRFTLTFDVGRSMFNVRPSSPPPASCLHPFGVARPASDPKTWKRHAKDAAGSLWAAHR